VANGNDPGITSSNFEAEVELITRFADSEKIKFAHNGPLWALYTLAHIKHVRKSTDLCKGSLSAAFRRLTYSQNYLRRTQFCGADLQGATDRHKVLQMFFALNKPNPGATRVVFYTAVTPQPHLWPLHCLVSLLYAGDLSSHVSQMLCFLSVETLCSRRKALASGWRWQEWHGTFFRVPVAMTDTGSSDSLWYSWSCVYSITTTTQVIHVVQYVSWEHIKSHFSVWNIC
jgi:hypothetical protein